MPKYELDDKTKEIILGLLDKCVELNIGNVKFEYYPTPGDSRNVYFALVEMKEFWELTVEVKDFSVGNYIDIYKVVDGEIIFRHSESA
ncbi:hypothetical protein V6C27_13715 [Peptococcaceae bacterium 1198_IL3148]